MWAGLACVLKVTPGLLLGGALVLVGVYVGALTGSPAARPGGGAAA